MFEKEQNFSAFNIGNIPKYSIQSISNALLNISGEFKFENISDKFKNLKGIPFVDKVLNELNLEISFSEKDIKKIPKKGGFVVISNHPFGSLDALFLIKLISQVRPDFKLITKYKHKSFNPIADSLLFEENDFLKEKDYSYAVLTEGFQMLHSGAPVAIFPAQESTSLSLEIGSLSDKKWNAGVMKFIKFTKFPILPIRIQTNENIFSTIANYFNSKTKNIIQTEISKNKKKQQIIVRIGNQITVAEQKEFSQIPNFTRFVRAKTYLLGSNLNVNNFYFPKVKVEGAIEEIQQETEISLIEKEIHNLKSNLVVTQQNFDVFFADSSSIPNILNEIGRLREITFRLVGEGTNKSCDLDEFDLYYQHLILWDKEAKKIAGAYRIGKGAEIFAKYGKKGFYTSSLFKYAKSFYPILQQSIELGRSFVIPDYQQKRLPLFLLWKGLMFYILNNKNYRYLLGPVSISNSYSKISQSVLVEFIRNNYFNTELSKMVKPKKPFRPNFGEIDKDSLLDSSKDDFKKIDKLLDDIESDISTAPVLLKKYIRENAKIISFNIDPIFNNALDGLMILDFQDISKETFEVMSQNINL